MSDQQGRRWITPRECSQRLGIHLQTCYHKFYAGQLPGGRLGRSVRIDWLAVEAKLEGKPLKPGGRR
jgi:excisionase family DNA binding protein